MEELRTLNDELSERTAELELAIGARSRFYASMSHELRTPINAILGYTALLLDDIAPDWRRRYLSSTFSLEQVISQIEGDGARRPQATPRSVPR